MNNILILAGMSLVAILLTYIFTKRSADKKVGQFKSLDEALTKVQEELETLTKTNESVKQSAKVAIQELSTINAETAELQALKGQDESLQLSIQEQQASLETIKGNLGELNTKIENGEFDLNELMGGIDLYSRLDEYTVHGHFEMPKYLYETSVRYAEEIKYIRQQQKDMIKDKTAITFPATTVISSDKAFNKKILNGQDNLILTAFNIECDMMIGKV